MAAIGKAEENGYAERVIRTIKEEEVDLSEYLDFADAARQIGHFIEDVYMTKRIHSSLGYLTPAEYEQDIGLLILRTPWFLPKKPEFGISRETSDVCTESL
jgi:transposase InsO family protein